MKNFPPLILVMFLMPGCGKKLTREQAKASIIQKMALPKTETEDFPVGPIERNESWSNGMGLQYLEQEGYFKPQLLGYVETYMGRQPEYDRSYTEKAKAFLVQGRISSNVPMRTIFRTGTITLTEVTGIAVRDDNTADVTFTLLKSPTPFGIALGSKSDKVLNMVAVFKKFDDGWRVDEIHEAVK